VHNLGIKVNISDMVAKAVEVKADAIGMSGLLVKSTLIMRETLEELNSRGLAEVPVLLGGAALTRTYVERDLREVYDGRLFYGKDAFEGLHVMDRIGAVKRGEVVDDPDWGTVPNDSPHEQRGRFHYPRQRKAPYLCIADFFRPASGEEVDYAAFHIVTMGPAVSEATAKLFADDRYQEYLLLHGLGVELAEALAELWHKRIRTEWGFVDEDGPALAGLFRQQYRGGRYSSGYPACPDLEDNTTILELLDGGRIGLECSEDTGYQYQPEQTTSALICHHPQAKYFVAR
jgi:cobalamin-dependent methionine synthase I